MPGAAFTVTIDDKDLARLRRLRGVSPVLAAKALTFTAEKAILPWIIGQGIFHHRNTWIDRGVRMRPATAGNLNAQVGTVDKFMGRHIKGIDEPKEGNLFIPIYRSIGEALMHNQERRAMARMKDTKRKPFILRTKGGVFIARRLGASHTPLEILGKLQQGAKVHPELDALAIVDGVVKAEFPPIYERLLLRWADTGAV